MIGAQLFECFERQLANQDARLDEAVERWLYSRLGEPVFDGVNFMDARVSLFGELMVCGSVWALETQRLHPFEFTLARRFDGWVHAALRFGDEQRPEGFTVGTCTVIFGEQRAWRVHLVEHSRVQ